MKCVRSSLLCSRRITILNMRCWGAEICHDTDHTPGFECGKAHFKNKFCPICKEVGVFVPSWRMRALNQEMQEVYTSNSLSAGFWKIAPASRASAGLDSDFLVVPSLLPSLPVPLATLTQRSPDRDRAPQWEAANFVSSTTLPPQPDR